MQPAPPAVDPAPVERSAVPGRHRLSAVGDLLLGERLRATGFIVTIYGDVAEPRGGRLWMGKLIGICGLVGISETLLRTAVSRLVAAGRLEGARDGRRSHYRLTEAARREFAAAAARIFAAAEPPGRWLLAGAAADGDAADAAAELAAAGFQPMGGGLWLGVERPGMPPPPAAAFTLRAEPATGAEAFRRFAAERWRLAAHAAAYATFCAQFAPLAAALAAGGTLDGEASLVARLLLVHRYRTVALDDPHLPPEVLGPDWPGERARALFAGLYCRLSPAADAFVATAFAADGPLPAETEGTRRRLHALAAG